MPISTSKITRQTPPHAHRGLILCLQQLLKIREAATICEIRKNWQAWQQSSTAAGRQKRSLMICIEDFRSKVTDWKWMGDSPVPWLLWWRHTIYCCSSAQRSYWATPQTRLRDCHPKPAINKSSAMFFSTTPQQDLWVVNQSKALKIQVNIRQCLITLHPAWPRTLKGTLMFGGLCFPRPPIFIAFMLSACIFKSLSLIFILHPIIVLAQFSQKDESHVGDGLRGCTQCSWHPNLSPRESLRERVWSQSALREVKLWHSFVSRQKSRVH